MPVSQFIIAFWIALSSALPLEGEQTTTLLPRGLCKGPTGDPMVCNDSVPQVPTNTVDYNCVPPLNDAAGHKQIYTFIDPTHEQMAVNRLIEKAMGRGECDSLHYWLQSIYSDYGSYLASDYALPMYSPYLRAENEANPLKCEVRCIDATDPDTVSYCNAKGCGTDINHSATYVSPDNIVLYDGQDVSRATYPCQNLYATTVSVNLCPITSPVNLGPRNGDCLSTCLNGPQYVI